MTDPTRAFTLRRATSRDAAILSELRAALFDEIGRHSAAAAATASASDAVAPPAFASTCVAAFTRLLDADLARAWLAETDDGERVGTAVLLLFPRLPTPALAPEREGYLLNVFTRPAWRGQGVAGALVCAAVAEARALGLARVRLHTTAAGEPVYASAGFRLRSDEMELRF
jgi:GNAT superfamily N-acetyltransferase